MSKADRLRACYQHCCTMYVTNRRMTNQTLRDRFGLPEGRAATASLIISKVKLDDADTASRRYARYLPFWA